MRFPFLNTGQFVVSTELRGAGAGSSACAVLGTEKTVKNIVAGFGTIGT